MNEELCQKLNDLGATPVVDSGVLTGLEVPAVGGGKRLLTRLELRELKLDAPGSALGCVDAHPEGSDRGGYVPTLNAGPFYYGPTEEWQT